MGNLCNIDVLDSITCLSKILVFERYMGDKCGSKNGNQSKLGPKEIELHAQNMITILGSIVNPKHQRSAQNLEFINVVRYMGLLMLLLLVEHLYFSGKW